MGRTTRIVAGTLAIASLGIAGAQSGAIANNITNTCTHGVANYNSGHDRVVYESARNSAGAHIHKYKHDVNNWPDHHPERNC